MLQPEAVDSQRPPEMGLPGRIGRWVFVRVAKAAPEMGHRIQRGLIRAWYTLFSRMLPKGGDDVTFLNYGYASLDSAEPGPALLPQDSDEAFGIALYHHVAGARDLRGKDVLEVGCGRGGGSSYIARYLGPRHMTGVDFAAPAVKFCRRRHQRDGLTFREGNAEQLPFEAGSFDAVVNVESSHCYPSFERFLAEVSRVLRPGGHFLFADLRPRNDVEKTREQLRQVFTVVEEEEITANVFRALELYSERRESMIQEKVPTLLRKAVRNFAAVEGTVAFEAFRRRDLQYLRFVLSKR